MNPEQMEQMSQIMGAGIGIGGLIFCLVIYLFFAFCLAKIGQKLGKSFGSAFIMAIIPIANIILLLQLAQKPIWWIILLLIPLVNIVIFAMVWMAIAEKRGKPGWWGILMLVPIANLVVLLMLSFGK